MSKTDQDVTNRRMMIAGLGAATAGLTLGATSARAQNRSSAFQPARHQEDAWMGQLSGSHRIFIDSATANGGGEALLYANNLYNAQEGGYGGGAADLAMVVCFRHFSTPFGYGDAIWAKYGEVFSGLIQFTDPDTGQAPAVNLMNQADRPTLPNFGSTIDSVVARGTQFAVCNAATQFFAGQIAAATGASTDDVYQELVANVIPNGRFVSAGVMALTRAQEYGYSVLIAG